MYYPGPVIITIYVARLCDAHSTESYIHSRIFYTNLCLSSTLCSLSGTCIANEYPVHTMAGKAHKNKQTKEYVKNSPGNRLSPIFPASGFAMMCTLLCVLPVLAATSSNHTRNFTTSDFAPEEGSLRTRWRGYKLRLKDNVIISALRGGATTDDFEIAIFRLHSSSENPDKIDKIMAVVPAPSGIRGGVTNLSEPITLFPQDKYYLAQGRVSEGSGTHYTVGSIDVEELTESALGFISQWKPSNGLDCFRSTTGNSTSLVGQEISSTDSVKPDVGFIVSIVRPENLCTNYEIWNAGENKCTPCVNGKVPNNYQNECDYCELYQIATEQDSECLACPNGTVPNQNQSACRDCELFEIATGKDSECFSCPDGTIPNDDQNDCIQCESYQIATEQDVACTVCPNGTVPNADQNDCSLCEPYQIATEEDSECSVCTIGRVPNIDQSFCIPCESYQIATGEDSHCSRCPNGTIPNNEQSECISVACAPYQIEIATGDGAECLNCSYGQVPNVFKSECIDCAQYAIATEFDTECSACPNGTVPNQNQSACRDCEQYEIASEEDSRCSLCPNGTVPNANQNGCKDCKLHEISPEESIDCSPCPNGTIPNAFRSECIDCASYEIATEDDSICSMCPNGTVPNDNQSECISCEPFQIAGEKDGECSVCPNGQVPNVFKSVCIDCAPYEIATVEDTACRLCEPGYVPNVKNNQCVPCESYEYSGTRDIACQSCGFGNVPNKSKSGCKPCEPHEVSNFTDSFCSSCGPGKMPNSVKNACVQCLGYEYSGYNDSICYPCGIGRVPDEEQGRCIKCALSEYSAVEDSECNSFLDQDSPSDRSNQSFTVTVESNCDVVEINSSCAMVGFNRDVSAPVNVDVQISGNSPPENVKNQTNFVSFIRSRDGSSPNVEVSCTDAAADDPQVFAGCNPLLPNVELPVKASYRVIRNSSCDQQTHCRNFLLSASLQLVENASALLLEHVEAVRNVDRQRQLSSGDSIMLPFKTSVGTFHDPSLVQVDQGLEIGLSVTGDSSTNATLRSVEPRILLVTYTRRGSTLKTLYRTLLLTLLAFDEWKWDVQTDAQDYIQVPEGGTTSNAINTSETVKINPDMAPTGERTVTLTVEIRNQITGHKDIFLVKLILRIEQAFPRVSQTLLRVTRSMSDPPEVRSIDLANDGEAELSWSASLLEFGNNISAWVQLDEAKSELTPKTLSPGESVDVDLHFLPDAVPSTGIYGAFLLIETDAWRWGMGEASTGKSSKSHPNVLNGTSAWIELELLVTTVFMCKPDRLQPPLTPFDEHTVPITMINTGIDDLLILPENFTIRELDTFSFATHNIQPRRLRTTLNLGSWASLSPVSQRLRSGSSGSFHLLVFYKSPRLFLWTNYGKSMTNATSFHISFTFSILRYREGRYTMVEHQSVNTQVSLAPGPAGAQNSRIDGLNTTRIPVGEGTAFRVLFRDLFNNAGAYAKYLEDPSNAKGDDEQPSTIVVATSARSHSSSLAFDLEIQRSGGPITSGRSTTNLAIKAWARFYGNASIDIRLNGTSVRGSPVLLTAVPVQCLRRFEIPDEIGLTCVCRPGSFRSSQGGCILCPEGTFSPTASNQGSCESCPDDFFSEPGSSQCYRCPPIGVTCSQGKLRLESHTWCDLCVKREPSSDYPRETIVQKLKKEEPMIFFRCRHREACMVNSTGFTAECTDGYTGPLCDVCKEGYVKDVNERTCFSCQNRSENMIYTAVQFSVVLIAIVFVAYNNAKRETEEIPTSNFEKTMTMSLEEVVLAFVDYLQMLSILTSLEINPFSGEFSELLRWSYINPTRSSRLQCLVGVGVYHSSLITMVSPLPLSLLILLIQCIVCWVQHRRFPSQAVWRKTAIPTVIRFLNFLHASVSGIALSSLSVYDQPIDSASRLSLDLSLKVGETSSAVLRICAGVTMAVYVVGFPLGTCIYFFKQFRASMKEGSVENVYITLLDIIGGYRVEGKGYMWPQITILRKVLMAFVVAYRPRPLVQLVSFTAISLGSYFVCATMRPHKAQMVTRVELFNTASVWLTAGLGALRFLLAERDTLLSSVEHWADWIQILVVIVQCMVAAIAVFGFAVFFPYVFVEKYRMLLQCWQRMCRAYQNCMLTIHSHVCGCLSSCKRKVYNFVSAITPSTSTHKIGDESFLGDSENGAFTIHHGTSTASNVGHSKAGGDNKIDHHQSRRRAMLREPQYLPRNREAKEQKERKPENKGGRGRSNSQYLWRQREAEEQREEYEGRLERSNPERSGLNNPKYKPRNREGGYTSVQGKWKWKGTENKGQHESWTERRQKLRKPKHKSRQKRNPSPFDEQLGNADEADLSVPIGNGLRKPEGMNEAEPLQRHPFEQENSQEPQQGRSNPEDIV